MFSLLGAVAMATPLVLGHRGAPGYLPDHTLEGYRLAIEMGADYIEPDLVSTKDGVLVARHENELSQTTDVAEKFPSRKTTHTVDGKAIEGWFAEDLTLAEVRTLRARQPMAARPHEHDGEYGIPTFDEVLDLAVTRSRELGSPIGVYPETKHPSYFDGIGLSLEEPLLRSLAAHGLGDPGDPVFIQSFERANLEELRKLTRLRLIRLVDEPGDLLTVDGLKTIATYADGIGVHKTHLIAADGVVNSVLRDAHRLGLLVHVYTFRREPEFLPEWAHGDPVAELKRFYALGVDRKSVV